MLILGHNPLYLLRTLSLLLHKNKNFFNLAMSSKYENVPNIAKH